MGGHRLLDRVTGLIQFRPKRPSDMAEVSKLKKIQQSLDSNPGIQDRKLLLIQSSPKAAGQGAESAPDLPHDPARCAGSP